MSNPPALPQALLHLLLPVDARETVSGDLLEEYREARIPALGRLRANVWYWRQAGGIWLHAYWWFAVPIVFLLVVHDIFNTFRAPSGASHLDRLPTLAVAPMPPLVAVGVFVLAGALWKPAHAAMRRRTRRRSRDVLRRVGLSCSRAPPDTQRATRRSQRRL